jgi:hypothetical protein
MLIICYNLIVEIKSLLFEINLISRLSFWTSGMGNPVVPSVLQPRKRVFYA